jgi:transcriptional regulator with XRE-family HTH domain
MNSVQAPQNAISRIAYRMGLTDGELARRAGMTRSRLNRIKNRRLRPTVADALLISRALGVPLSRAFCLQGEDQVENRREDGSELIPA